MFATTATATPTSTPSSDTVWAQLADLDDLVESGDRRRALSKARRLLDIANGAAREELADLVASIEQTRDAAWEARDTHQPTRWERPRDAKIRRVEPQPARPTGHRGDAQAARYLADQPAPAEPDRRHPDDGATYDPDAELAAAIEPLRGAACLGCGIERSSIDRATGDGVCESCRDNPDAAGVEGDRGVPVRQGYTDTTDVRAGGGRGCATRRCCFGWGWRRRSPKPEPEPNLQPLVGLGWEAMVTGRGRSLARSCPISSSTTSPRTWAGGWPS
jgi:hypothetical protein